MKEQKTGQLKQDLILALTELGEEASAEEINKSIDATYKKHEVVWKSPVGRWFFATSAVTGLVTLFIVLYTQCQTVWIIAYITWTLIPPAWMLLEYVWLFPDHLKLISSQSGDLKYTQGLASKIWAGLVIIIGIVLFKKLKGE